MLRKGLLSLLLLSSSASFCLADGLGKYVGSVQTEWVDSDRKMRLLAPFTYVDPKGVEWTAPAGWVIDGASIPVFAWSIIGGPYNGKYRNASVIHDVACDQKAQPWEKPLSRWAARMGHAFRVVTCVSRALTCFLRSSLPPPHPVVPATARTAASVTVDGPEKRRCRIPHGILG